MATTPTSNPIPSESPRDLKFNAGKIDEFVNSPEEAFSDRFGKARMTIAGIEAEAAQAYSSIGFIPVDSFEDGATLIRRNEALHYEADDNYYRWDGELPKDVSAGSTPASSGGVGTGAWVNVTDGTLRSNLFSDDVSLGDALVAVKSPLTGGTKRTQHQKNMDVISIMDFGAVGDGVTDDSAAFNAAWSACVASGKSLDIGSYKIKCGSPSTMSGRVFLVGSGRGELIGKFTYSDTFPVSADTATPPDESSPFFSAYGVNFRNNSTTDYALTVVAQGGFSFLDCMEISECKFYGYYGLRTDNLISVTLDKCWFYSLYIGFDGRGCTNGNVMGCWFRNARKKAVYLTFNPNYTNRIGGENFRFTNCEFAVCTMGIHAGRHVWLNVSNCLFDYCTLPIYGEGSYYAKVMGSYLGAANQGSLSGQPGYEAPPTLGCAMYFKGAPADSNFPSASYCGVTAINNEFVNYLSGTTNPIVIIDGYLSASVSQLTRHTAFMGNKFLMLQSHSATTMLSISYAEESTVVGNNFISPNLSSTLLAPYVSTNSNLHNGAMNNSVECTQGGIRVQNQYDYQTSNGLVASPNTGVWLKDAGNVDKIGVNSAGVVALSNATVSDTATGGGKTLPQNGPAGFVSAVINGTNVKLPYYLP